MFHLIVSIASGVTFLGIVGVAQSGLADGDAKAKALAEVFVKALTSLDTKKVIQVVDAPFFYDRDVVQSKEKLDKRFAEEIALRSPNDAKKLARAKIHFRKVDTLAKFREDEKFREMRYDEPLRMFSNVLRDKDRLVWVDLELDESFTLILVGVRLDGEKSKIVGFYDG